METTSVLGIFVVFIALYVIYSKLWVRKRLPPGPRGYPLLGNVLRYLEARKSPATFAHFLDGLSSFGEMTTLQMGARTWIVLNSSRVVKEIIAKQAAVTGERPDLPVSSGLVSRNNRTVLKKTQNWLEGRKLMHHLLNGTALRAYGRIQEEESARLLHDYLHIPQQWYRHHYDYSYSIIHRIVLGERPKTVRVELDDFRRITVEFILSITASIFDFFPDLGVLQPYRHWWSRMGVDHNNVFKDWWAPIKADIATGEAKPSFVRDVLLASKTRFATNNEEAMYLASSVVAAGSDNVRRAHNVLMMAMCCHPEVVEKARRDIDSVCGNADRLPSVDDLESLPYLSAIIKECLRWRPVVPIIPPHHSTRTIHFEGYEFPPGTDFVVNSLAVANEVDAPEEFRPERWLGKELNITEDLWAFGGGRRICVGYKIAHQELFLALAGMIYCFDVTNDGPMDNRKMNHHVVGAPFPVKVMPRSQLHMDLIEKVNESMSDDEKLS